MPGDRQLTDADVEALAARIAELTAPDGERWMTAAQVARLLQVDVAFVYDHQAELGVRRLGAGKRPPLRFRLDLVQEGVEKMDAARAKPKPARRRGRPRKTDAPAANLLGGMRARPV